MKWFGVVWLVVIILALDRCTPEEVIRPDWKENKDISGVILFGSPKSPNRRENRLGEILMYALDKESPTIIEPPERKILVCFLTDTTHSRIIGFFEDVDAATEDEWLVETWIYPLNTEVSQWEPLNLILKRHVAFNVSAYDENTLIIPAENGQRLISIADGSVLREFSLADLVSSDEWFASQKKYFYYNGEKKKIAVMEADGKTITLYRCKGFCEHISPIDNEHILFTREKKIFRYDLNLQKEKEIAEVEGRIYRLAVSPNGRYAAVYFAVDGLVGCISQSIVIIDLQDGKSYDFFSQPFENSITSLEWY